MLTLTELMGAAVTAHIARFVVGARDFRMYLACLTRRQTPSNSSTFVPACTN